MSLKDTWRPRVDGVDNADSSAVNEIAEAVIQNEKSIENMDGVKGFNPDKVKGYIPLSETYDSTTNKTTIVFTSVEGLEVGNHIAKYIVAEPTPKWQSREILSIDTTTNTIVINAKFDVQISGALNENSSLEDGILVYGDCTKGVIDVQYNEDMTLVKAYVDGDYNTYGFNASVEGNSNQGLAISSHTEGNRNITTGISSHNEGSKNTVSGPNAHGEGYGNKVLAENSHGEGASNTLTATAKYGHVEGHNNTVSGYIAHGEGYKNNVSGQYAHGEGSNNIVSGYIAHGEGFNNEVRSLYAHGEGAKNVVSGNQAHGEGHMNNVSGQNAHGEGYNNTVSATSSHGEGAGNKVSGENSHGEGFGNEVSGANAHGEGSNNTVSGNQAHSEGAGNKVLAENSHGEGALNTLTATAKYGHVEGHNNSVSGYGAHGEGFNNEVKGEHSHTEGYGNIASSNIQHVQGKFNIEDKEHKYAHIVGGGTSEEDRKNIHTVDWSGNAEFAGTVSCSSVILTSPNGKKFKLTVGDDGSLATEVLNA